MNNISDIQKKIVEDIQKYGWHVIKVLEDEAAPAFGYSIGLFKTFTHPEILIVGLNLNLIHEIINDIGKDVKSGKIYTSLAFYPHLTGGFECYFTQVKQEFYEQYVGQALWYYDNNSFPLLQCIYPTTKGTYPWEKDSAAGIKDIQPILGEIKLN